MKIAVITEAINRKNGGNGSLIDLINSLHRIKQNKVYVFQFKRNLIFGFFESIINNGFICKKLKLDKISNYDLIFCIASVDIPSLRFLRISNPRAKIITFQTSDVKLSQNYKDKMLLCDYILFQSPGHKNDYELIIKDIDLIEPAKPVLFEPTIDEKKFTGKSLEKDVNSYVCVGSIQKRKNQLYLVKVIRRMVEISPRIKLYLVGSCLDYEYCNEIRDYIVKNSLEKNIFMLGHRRNYYKILSSAACVFSVSLEEGLSTIIRESLFLGKLIIASRIKGVKGTLNSGNSILFDLSMCPDELGVFLTNIIIDSDQVLALESSAAETYLRFSTGSYDTRLRKFISELNN